MQRCTEDEETGEVTVRLGRTDIVKVGALQHLIACWLSCHWTFEQQPHAPCRCPRLARSP